MVESTHLLTNARCRSTCGIAGYFYNTKHNVESYSIGSIPSEDISMFLIAGASILRQSEIKTYTFTRIFQTPWLTYNQNIVIFFVTEVVW